MGSSNGTNRGQHAAPGEHAGSPGPASLAGDPAPTRPAAVDTGPVVGTAVQSRSPRARHAAGAEVTRPRSVRPRVIGAVGATALVLVVYFALAVVCYWHAWTGGLSSVAQPGGDQVGTIWFLYWVPYALVHGHNPFFTTYANFPYGVNLIVNTSVPLLGLLAAPLTWLAGSTASFNVLQTLALAGSAASAYFVIRRFTTWRPAAFVGGLTFGFSPYEIGQNAGGHLNLAFVVLPPIILLMVHDLAVTQTGRARRRGAILGLLCSAQFFISAEVLLTTLVMAVVLLCLLAMSGHRVLREHLRYAVEVLGWAAAVTIVLLAVPAWYALRGPGHVNGPIQTVSLFRADLLGPLVPDQLQWLAPHSLAATADHFAGGFTENGSYLGLTLLVVLAVGAVLLRRLPLVRVVVAMGAVALVFSLGDALVVKAQPAVTAAGAAVGDFPLPGALLSKVPILSKSLPARFSMYVALAAALLLAVILDRLRRYLAGRGIDRLGTVLAPAMMAAVALVPLVPAVPFVGIVPLGVPTYFSSAVTARIPPGGVAVTYPYPSEPVPAPLLWQIQAGLRYRTPGGYFLVPQGPGQTLAVNPLTLDGRSTTTGAVFTQLYQGDPPARTASLRNRVREELASWHTTTVLAVPSGAQPAMVVPYLTWLLGRAPVRQSDVFAWYGLT